MSKVIATGAILGSHYYVKQAEALVEKAITRKARISSSSSQIPHTFCRRCSP